MDSRSYSVAQVLDWRNRGKISSIEIPRISDKSLATMLIFMSMAAFSFSVSRNSRTLMNHTRFIPIAPEIKRYILTHSQ